MWSRSDLKERAKINVHESYWGLVLCSLVLGLAIGGSSGGSSSGGSNGGVGDLAKADPALAITILVGILVIGLFAMAIGFAFSAFVGGPLEVGCRRYFMNAACAPQTTNDLNIIGLCFKGGIYMNVVKVMFLRKLKIFLWSLLFIVPGIIKSYEYRMVPYLLAENPMMTSEEAHELSSKMMDGEKMNAWILDLSFIGWYLLTIFTCGLLAIFYVSPYTSMTNAHLFYALKEIKRPFGSNGSYVESVPFQEM